MAWLEAVELQALPDQLVVLEPLDLLEQLAELELLELEVKQEQMGPPVLLVSPVQLVLRVSKVGIHCWKCIVIFIS